MKKIVTLMIFLIFSMTFAFGIIVNDNFNDNTLNADLWNTTGPFPTLEQNERIEVKGSSYGGWSGLESDWFLDLSSPFKLQVDFANPNGYAVAFGLKNSKADQYVWIAHNKIKTYLTGPGGGSSFVGYVQHFMGASGWEKTSVSSGTFYLWSDSPYTLSYGGYGYTSPHSTVELSSWGTNYANVYFNSSSGTATFDNFQLVQGNALAEIPENPTVPEPMTLFLFLSSLLGLGFYKKKIK